MPGKRVNVFDVAVYILKKTGPITAMKLQKLVYYCQAWSLVWDQKLLYPERIEAWASGPVVKKVYQAHRGKFEVKAKDFPSGDPEKLSATQKETVDSVLQYYGGKSSQWLSELTHLEDPWKNARKGIADLQRSNRQITNAAMHEYYDSL